MTINTSFEITEDNILGAIKDCRSEYHIDDIDKDIALAAIVANVLGIEEYPTASDKIAACLLDDDSQRSLLETFAVRLCDQIYHEITERFELGS